MRSSAVNILGWIFRFRDRFGRVEFMQFSLKLGCETLPCLLGWWKPQIQARHERKIKGMNKNGRCERLYVLIKTVLKLVLYRKGR
jgi:hypothetical protein